MVSVQLADLRRSEREREGCADSGHLPEQGQAIPGDPFRPFAVRGGGIPVAHRADPARAGRYLPIA